MGMSDNQFDAYKRGQLHLLQIAQKEVAESGKSETLDKVIEDLKSELKKAVS